MFIFITYQGVNMPKYPYFCPHCENLRDIIKPVRDIDRLERCETCDTELDSSCRRIGGGTYFIGASVEDAEFNPGLGCVVKNKRHREQICKDRGLIEIGNDVDPKKQAADIDRAEKRRTKELVEGILSCSN